MRENIAGSTYGKKVTLYGDYMLPIKIDTEGYKVQIEDELIEVLRYIGTEIKDCIDDGMKVYIKKSKSE